MPEQIVVGRGAALSLGAQGTHASAAATSIDLPIISATVQREERWTTRKHLTLGTAGFTRSARVVTAIRRNLKTEMELAYSGQGLLLRAALGDAATTGGSAPYTHTYTCIALLPMLTGVLHEGTATATVSASKSTLDSLVVGQLRISVKTGEIARLGVDMVGRSEARTTTTAPTPTVPNPVMGRQGSTIAWNSTTITVDSAEIVLDNALDAERGALGSAYISRPHPGQRSVRMTIVTEVIDDLAYAALVAGTTSDAVLTLTGDGNESMTITLHNAQILEDTTPVDTVNALKRTVVFEGTADATDQGFKIVVVNDVSTAIL